MKDLSRLQRIKERAEKASPGPIMLGPDDFFHGQIALSAISSKRVPVPIARGILKREDADLFSKARDDILYLLKLLDDQELP